MIACLLAATACLLSAEEVRWIALDLGSEGDPIVAVTAEQAQSWAKEQGWSFSMEEPPAEARPIGFAGEESWLLWTLISIRFLDTPRPPRDL